jgi:hypothetical protein
MRSRVDVKPAWLNALRGCGEICRNSEISC